MQEVVALHRDADRLVATLSGGAAVAARAVVLATGVDLIAGSASTRSRASGAPASSTAAPAPTRIEWPARMSRARRGELRPARRRSTSRGTRGASRSSYARRRSRRACLITSSSSWPRRRTSTSGWAPRSWAEEAPAGSHMSCCATGRAAPRRDGCGRWAVPLDRGPSADGAAPRRDRARRPGLRPHGPRHPEAPSGAVSASSVPARDEQPGVRAVGDARYGSVKRVASAVGAGSIAIRVLHGLLDADTMTNPTNEMTELRSA